MKTVKRYLLSVIDDHFFLLITAVSLFVMWLNYDATTMKNIIPYYFNIKRIILSGFDPGVSIPGGVTFPMWGYGWLLIITENKTVILLFQNIFAVFSLWFFIERIKNNNELGQKGMRMAKILTAGSLPLFAFHSVMWPYSVSISLFLLSFILFYEFINDGNFPKALVSAGLFGLLLNFRSEFIFLPIVMVLAVMLAGRFNKACIAWLLIIFLMLIPWGFYAKNATGRFFFTSTNGGMHFFCGLGNMPGNKWGITYDDGDKQAKKLLMETFKDKYYTNIYLSAEGDKVLKDKFTELVKNDPLEYVKKSFYTLMKIITKGAYSGEFYNNGIETAERKEAYREIRRKILFDPLSLKVSVFLLRCIMQIISTGMSMVLYFISFIVLPFTAIYAFKRGRVLFMLVTSAIAYQTFLNMLGGYIALYSSNMYFFHVLNVVYFISIVSSMCVSKRKARDER